jgi:hypothetical protein
MITLNEYFQMVVKELSTCEKASEIWQTKLRHYWSETGKHVQLTNG